jgi:hypothetical protein
VSAHPTEHFICLLSGPGYFDTDFSVEKAFAMPKWEKASSP